MDSSLSQLTRLLLERKVIDLSHAIEEDMPVWPTHPRFYCSQVETYHKGDEAFFNMLCIGEHCGTHVDAPSHMEADTDNMDQVDPLHFVGRGLKIDMSSLPPCGLITAQMIKDWEVAHCPLEAGDIVLFDIGWEKHWGLKPNYKQFLSNWPGLAVDGADYLVSRKVKAVGTDSMALDAFGSVGNPAHHALLPNNVLVIENLKNLDKITEPCLFMALPLKIRGGSGSPVRAIAFV
jgi:Predicted metal-dependent hydrolase